MTSYVDMIAEVNAEIDSRLQGMFPEECIVECPALRLVVSDHKTELARNAEGMSHSDFGARAVILTRREEMITDFSRRITFMSDRCMVVDPPEGESPK